MVHHQHAAFGTDHADLRALGRIGAAHRPFAVADLGAAAAGGLGQPGAWCAASGRLPFVAGLDRFLPPVFGRIHPRYHSPYVSLGFQAAVAAVFIFLGQAGTTVRGAYDVLVSMSIIAYFIPYLFIFAAMIRLQREPAGPGVIRVPGGRMVASALAGLGFCTTAGSIVLAAIPAEQEPNKELAVSKVLGLTLLLVLAGAAVYLAGRRRIGGAQSFNHHGGTEGTEGDNG